MKRQRKDFELFCHVGLGKTASTFLQYKFFPRLKGIHYIQRTRYNRFDKVVSRKKHAKYLVSREFDRQFEREVKKIAEKYPRAHIIIVIRRNDSWMASQYRRYVKNGGLQPFENFVDIENDQGLWKKKDIYFYNKLRMIKDLFETWPLVLFHDELKQDAYGFFDKLAWYMGVDYNRNRIDVDPSHKSYSDKQLKILRRFNRRWFGKDFEGSGNKVRHYIRFRLRWLFNHLILYIAAFLPERYAGTEPLIPAGHLGKIREHYANDWKRCREFAKAYSYDWVGE
ncbi:MAG: hypothetical protein K9H65_03320 [Bacteroidales bacterium]|nr:hypothetical protein [Bacteroidales bacterium]